MEAQTSNTNQRRNDLLLYSVLASGKYKTLHKQSAKSGISEDITSCPSFIDSIFLDIHVADLCPEQ